MSRSEHLRRALTFLAIGPLIFIVLNWATSSRPLLTDFEGGYVAGVVAAWVISALSTVSAAPVGSQASENK